MSDLNNQWVIPYTNLNELPVEYHQVTDVDTGLEKATSEDGNVTVYFKKIEDHLIGHIKQADVVLGCVAWLTSKRILASLEGKIVALVVQKEDFLRPDIDNDKQDWPKKMRQLYSKLGCSVPRFQFPGLMGQLSTMTDETVQAVRCVGNYNRDKLPASPRMHHKFVVFCRYGQKIEKPLECDWESTPVVIDKIVPYAVWTGSFNFTQNAARSLENSLVLTDPNVVQAYYDEWARVEAISEELDWTSEWAAPEWRIGT